MHSSLLLRVYSRPARGPASERHHPAFQPSILASFLGGRGQFIFLDCASGVSPRAETIKSPIGARFYRPILERARAGHAGT